MLNLDPHRVAILGLNGSSEGRRPDRVALCCWTAVQQVQQLPGTTDTRRDWDRLPPSREHVGLTAKG